MIDHAQSEAGAAHMAIARSPNAGQWEQEAGDQKGDHPGHDAVLSAGFPPSADTS